jgi:tetratricopeptide (TPR) repeat protein
MKLVQKILSHGLLIAFVVAAFFLYTNRADLFPQWFAKSETSPVKMAAGEKPVVPPAHSVSRPKPEKVISKQPVAAPEPQPAATNESAGQDTAAPAAESGAGTQAEPPAEAEPVTAAADSGADAGEAVTAAPEQQQPSPATPAAQNPSEEPVPVAPARETDAAAETPAAPQPPAGETPPQQAEDARRQLQQQLEQARVLYWRKDMRGAELIYASLTQAHPQDPDVWGEAGNFYYSLQQREQAAEAYSRAIDLLLQQGEQQRAGQLLGVMHELDEDKARTLEMQLQQSGG